MTTRQVNPSLIDLFAETVIVGANPGCLFDSSDATYAEAVSSAASGSSVQALMDATTIASIATIPLFVRAMYRLASGPPPSPIGMTVNARNETTGEALGFFSSNVAYGYEFAATDTAYDITSWTWNEDHVGASADFVTSLAAGELRIRFDSRAVDLSDAGLRIIECYLFGDVSLFSTMRKYPNPTGFGVGPARHWPRPRGGVTGIR